MGVCTDELWRFFSNCGNGWLSVQWDHGGNFSLFVIDGYLYSGIMEVTSIYGNRYVTVQWAMKVTSIDGNGWVSVQWAMEVTLIYSDGLVSVHLPFEDRFCSAPALYLRHTTKI